MTAALCYYLHYYDIYNSEPGQIPLSITSYLLISAADNLLGFTAGALVCWRLPRRPTLLVSCVVGALASYTQLLHEYIGGTYFEIVAQHLVRILSGALFSQLYLVTMELTPVSHRGLICGICFGVSRIGAMVAPHLALFDIQELPNLITGTALLISSGLIVYGLPETKNKPTLYTFAQFVKHKNSIPLESSL